jgi:hypothetical protein
MRASTAIQEVAKVRSKTSRLALFGVLALVLSVTVGLVSGSVADAKKKKKKSGTVTVSKTTPTTIPAKASPASNDSLTTVPLTVGKKAKGKVVGWDSLTVTSTFTGSDDQALGNISARLTAPNGRTVGLASPAWNFTGTGNTTSGPLTETPDSPFGLCFSGPGPNNPCPGGNFGGPENTVGPPYVGTVANNDLALFGGVPAKGTWIVKLLNGSDTTTAVLNSITVRMTLKNAPV